MASQKCFTLALLLITNAITNALSAPEKDAIIPEEEYLGDGTALVQEHDFSPGRGGATTTHHGASFGEGNENDGRSVQEHNYSQDRGGTNLGAGRHHGTGDRIGGQAGYISKQLNKLKKVDAEKATAKKPSKKKSVAKEATEHLTAEKKNAAKKPKKAVKKKKAAKKYKLVKQNVECESKDTLHSDAMTAEACAEKVAAERGKNSLAKWQDKEMQRSADVRLRRLRRLRLRSAAKKAEAKKKKKRQQQRLASKVYEMDEEKAKKVEAKKAETAVAAMVTMGLI